MQQIQSYKSPLSVTTIIAFWEHSACEVASAIGRQETSKQAHLDEPEHIRVGVLGKLLREEIKLVLFVLGGVHWVLSKTGGDGWVFECKWMLYNEEKKRKKKKRQAG